MGTISRPHARLPKTEETMTNEQVDRMLSLLERYVHVEETKLALSVERVKALADIESRQTAALEEQAKGMRFAGDVKIAGAPHSP
jgi:phage I-like protein